MGGGGVGEIVSSWSWWMLDVDVDAVVVEVNKCITGAQLEKRCSGGIATLLVE